MKKYTIWIGVILCAVIAVGIVFKVAGSDASTAETGTQTDIVSGSAIFSEDSLEKVRFIEYVDAKGDKLRITDDRTISDLRNTLMNCSYIKLEEDDYLEGFYTFCLVTDSDRISVGLCDNAAAYNGAQYKVSGNAKLIPDSLAEVIK